MDMAVMDESPLDAVAAECAQLTAALDCTSSDADKDSIIAQHAERTWAFGEPVPDFQPELEWVNVSKPLSLSRDCADKIVVLDFFTYCCVNCHHVLPDLRELERLHSVEDGLVVIGVHSAKFDNEKETENILACVQRHDIRHPVLNDSESSAWGQLGIVCWPTLLILGPENRPIFVLTGEGHREELLTYCRVALRVFEDRLSPRQLPTAVLARVPPHPHQLRFPTKLSLNPFYSGKEEEPFLAISDSGNHRVVVAACSGVILKVVGGPDPGFINGKLSEARLDSPQGLCWLSGWMLVVCDTGNHTLRTVDLREDTVELLAGTGHQALRSDAGGNCMALQSLSSPWDVVLHLTPDMDLSVRAAQPPPPPPPAGAPAAPAAPAATDAPADERAGAAAPAPPPPPGSAVAPDAVKKELRRVLLVACAGSHQIWALFLDTTVWWRYKKYEEGTCVCVCGNGTEAARNSSYPGSASFAQPSGLAVRAQAAGGWPELLVADSESSSVRRVSLATGSVAGLAGGDCNPLNLFAYGDADGLSTEAKFQHPLGLAYCDATKLLYVADTYNHKLRSVHPGTQRVATLAPCFVETDRPVTLAEPSGLSCTRDGRYLYIADTNNHRVRIYNVAKNVCEDFDVRPPLRPIAAPKTNLIIYEKELAMNRNGGTMVLRFDINLERDERDVKLTPGSPQKWSLAVRDEAGRDASGAFEYAAGALCGGALPGRVELRLRGGARGDAFRLYLTVKLFLCEDGVCYTHEFTVLSNIVCRDGEKSLTPYKLMCTVNPQRV